MRVGVLLMVAVLGARAVMAQGEPATTTAPLDRFRPPIDDSGLATTEGGGVPAHLATRVGLVFNHAFNPFTLLDEDGADVAPIVAQRLAANASFSLGLFDAVGLGVDLPLTLLQLSGDIPRDVRDGLGLGEGLASVGVGDLRLIPKVRLLREDRHGVSVALIPTVTLPTATGLRVSTAGPSLVGGDYLGEGPGAFAFIPELAVSTNIAGVRPALNLAYRLRQPTRLLDSFTLHPEIVYRVGVGYDVATVVPSLSSLLVFGEVFGATADVDPFGLVDGDDATAVRLQNPLEVLVGARWRAPIGLALEAGIGAGLAKGFGTPDVRLVFGVRSTLDDQDRDRDGLDNPVDLCPDAAEDKDGSLDRDGCPDPDNDGDGLVDAIDRCPDAAEDIDGFDDDDGCVDPDNDGDGVLDADDTCRDVRGPAELKGCPG